MKNKIYISGPISNTPDYIERFSAAEKNLSSPVTEVFNPVRYTQSIFTNPEEVPWIVLMEILINKLKYNNFTHMYMMKGWQESDGAVIERAYARKLGIELIYEVEK